VIDEAAADLFLHGSGPHHRPAPADAIRAPSAAAPEATVLEVASDGPVPEPAIVVTPETAELGVITLDALLDRVLAA
jgi:hypothetical protein